MKLTHYMKQNTCVVSIFQNLALNEAGEARKYIEARCQDQEVQQLILNCSGVQIIDSLGINTIAAVLQLMAANEKQLILCGLTQHCLELLRFLKLDNHIPIFETEEQALANAQNQIPWRFVG